MYKYQNIPGDVGKGMKAVLNTVGSIITAPLMLPGIRTLTKSVIKGGLLVSGKTKSYYKQVESGLEQIVKEAKVEAKTTKQPPEKMSKRTRKTEAENKNYEKWHIDDLYERAQELDIKGRSTMNKEELIKQIHKAEE